MKKVYITGICGLLGNNIAKELAGCYEIIGADVTPIDVPNSKVYHFDLTDKNALVNNIEEVMPDVIIHTAAAVNVDRCETEREYAYKLNAELTNNLVKICSRLGIKLVYISTDAVFDGEKDGLYIEGDMTRPINYYGETKLEGELTVATLENGLVLRTNIYGVNIQDKLSFGEWIVTALREDKELNMFTDIIFSPILVNELANIMGICIEKNLCGIYHACGTGAVSKYDFGMQLKDVFEIQTGKINKATSDNFQFQAKRAKNMGMSNEKLRKTLNIEISTPFESIEKFKREMEKEGK